MSPDHGGAGGAKAATPPARRRRGCGRRMVPLLLFLLIAALVLGGIIYLRLPDRLKRDPAAAVAYLWQRAERYVQAAREENPTPSAREVATPAPPPVAPPAVDSEVPANLRSLPPPPEAPPAPVANTASVEAIPPAPAAPFPLPEGPFERTDPLVAQLWNGVVLETRLAPRPGTRTAPELAGLTGSILQNRAVSLRLHVPQPHQDAGKLSALNPALGKTMPSLAELLNQGKVSPAFAEIFRRKVEYQQGRATRLDILLSNHNFYDTETIVELNAGSGQRRALFIQSEMDTLTDGSDGDRFPEIVGESASFQPITAYGWPKRTARENPFLPKVREQIAELERTGATRQVPHLRRVAADLRARSFLVGWIDPFIALPGFLFRQGGNFSPALGDIAVILHQGRAFPAIVGDVGPHFKLGEASYLICQELNPTSSVMQRPISELTVSYIVFPGTAIPPNGPPDPVALRDRAAQLLRELDPATTVEMHLWPLPPVPIGYDPAIAFAQVSRAQRELWAAPSAFQPALSPAEMASLRTRTTALSAEQRALLEKATPKAR